MLVLLAITLSSFFPISGLFVVTLQFLLLGNMRVCFFFFKTMVPSVH